MKIRVCRWTFIAVAVATTIPLAAAQKVAPFAVSVFVDFAPPPVSPEGFVDASDKWLIDSKVDVEKALDGKDFHPNKGFPGSPSHYTLASDQDHADVVVTIAARGESTAQFGQRTTAAIYNSVLLVESVPNIGVTRWISAVISVGTYRKEFVAWAANRSRFSAGAWTTNAKNIALEVAAWVMANEGQIRKRQQDRPTGTPP